MFCCHRCGISTPRLTVDQTRCPECQRAFDQRTVADARKVVRFLVARDMRGVAAA